MSRRTDISSNRLPQQAKTKYQTGMDAGALKHALISQRDKKQLPAVIQIEFQDAIHNQAVQEILIQQGIQPGKIRFLEVFNQLRTTPETAEEYIVYNVSDSINEVSNLLEQRIQNQATRVINLSYSTSALNNYLGFFERYNTDNAFQQNARQTIGIADDATLTEQTQAIFSYVDELVATHPDIQNALNRYRQITEIASQKGYIIIVSAGNGQERIRNSQNEGYTLAGHGAYNFLAMSRFVISVAAVGILDNASAYQTTSFSAHGTTQFYPLIAADGFYFSKDIGKLEGTSYATPRVSAVVAKMLAENPNLTFSDVAAILQKTALTNPELNPVEAGLGLLQADTAMDEAKQYNNSSQSVAMTP